MANDASVCDDADGGSELLGQETCYGVTSASASEDAGKVGGGVGAADDDSEAALYHGENTRDGDEDTSDDSDTALYHGEEPGKEAGNEKGGLTHALGAEEDEDQDDFMDASENHHDHIPSSHAVKEEAEGSAETFGEGATDGGKADAAKETGVEANGNDDGENGVSRTRSPSDSGSDESGVVVAPPSPVRSCSTNQSDGDLKAVADILTTADHDTSTTEGPAAAEFPNSHHDLRTELLKVRRDLESSSLRQRKLELENSALRRDLTKTKDRLERKERQLSAKEKELDRLAEDRDGAREELAKELGGRGSLVSGISQENGRMIRKLRDLRDEKEELESRLDGLKMRLGACRCGCAPTEEGEGRSGKDDKLSSAGGVRKANNLAPRGTIERASTHSGSASSTARARETSNTAVDIWQSVRSIATADLSEEAATARPSRRNQRNRRDPSSGSSSLGSSKERGNDRRVKASTSSADNAGGIFQSMRRISMDLATEEIEIDPWIDQPTTDIDPQKPLPNVSTQSRDRATGGHRRRPQCSKASMSVRSKDSSGKKLNDGNEGGSGGGTPSGIFESMRSLSIDLQTEEISANQHRPKSRPKSRHRQNSTAKADGNNSDGTGGSIFQSMRNLSNDLMDEVDATPVSAATVRAASSYAGGGSSSGRSRRSREMTSAEAPNELPSMGGDGPGGTGGARSTNGGGSRNASSSRGSRHRSGSAAPATHSGGSIFSSMRSLMSVDMLSDEADSTLEAVSRAYSPARRHGDQRSRLGDTRRPSVEPSGAVQFVEKVTKNGASAKKSQSVRSLPTHLTASKRHLFNKSGARGGAGAKEPYISASTRLLRPETVPKVGGPSVEVDFPSSAGGIGGRGGVPWRGRREDYGREDIGDRSGSARSGNGLWATTSTRLLSGMADEVGA